MKIKPFVLGSVLLLITIGSVSACHKKVKRRAITALFIPPAPTPPKTVRTFFPACMTRQLSGISQYVNRNWRGVVDFVLDHSDWYEQANNLCFVDTVQCWVNGLPALLTQASPALLAAERCVKAYFDSFYRVNSFHPVYRRGFYIQRSAAACSLIDESQYASEFVTSVRTELGGGITSYDNTILNEFNDVIEFLQNDMICIENPLSSFVFRGSQQTSTVSTAYTECSCNRLESSGEELEYSFDDGRSCGSCWTTKLAVSLRRDSRFRRPANFVAKRRSGLQGMPRQMSPNNHGTPNSGAPISNNEPLPQEPGSLPQEPGSLPQQPGSFPQGPGSLPQGPGYLPQGPSSFSQGPGYIPMGGGGGGRGGGGRGGRGRRK